jgi:hypothetical protein
MLLILPFTYAWTSYTHIWICDKAGLSELDCAAADTPVMQSKYKDASFRNHHCTDNSPDCSAREVADKFLSMNTTETRGLAAHLYADSMVPVHWYSTDYDTCHKIFEDKVEEKLRNSEDINYKMFGKEYDFSSWNFSMQCVAKYGKENRTVDLYVDNTYMVSVARYVSEKMDSTPMVKEVKDYDVTPIVVLLIILVILVLLLFLYVGMKDKSKRK